MWISGFETHRTADDRQAEAQLPESSLFLQLTGQCMDTLDAQGGKCLPVGSGLTKRACSPLQ
jgi:hypothetical protein